MPSVLPTVIYDADCNLCVTAIQRWRRAAGRSVDFLAFQDPQTAQNFPGIDRKQLTESLHFVASSGEISHGAEAVFRLLAQLSWWKRWPLWCYEHLLGAAPVSERFYRFIAKRRRFLSRFSSTKKGR